MSQNVRVTKCKHHITLTTVTSFHFLTFTFWNYYVLKLLRLETITFSDAMLSDINAVLCYVLSQYRKMYYMFRGSEHGGDSETDCEPADQHGRRHQRHPHTQHWAYSVNIITILGTMDQISIKTQNPKCRLYWCSVEFIDWRYSLLVFSPPLVN